MRDLIISLVLFSLMIAAVAGNSIFVRREAEELTEAVRAVPRINSPECQRSVAELRLHWRDFKRVARIALNYSELNRMDCLIEELECHRQTGNVNDFEHAKVMMLNLLKEFVRHEKISLDGIT